MQKQEEEQVWWEWDAQGWCGWSREGAGEPAGGAARRALGSSLGRAPQVNREDSGHWSALSSATAAVLRTDSTARKQGDLGGYCHKSR